MPPTKRRASVAAAMAEAAAMDGYDEYEDLRPSKHAGVKRLSDEITCEICEGVLRDPATLPCCHTFCLACVEDKLQGHGVYESKCPRCGMPLHFKDLRVNQSYNGVIEQIESARARFSVERENREERDSPGPGPGLVPARTPKSGTREPPVPSTARCREIALDVRHIDAALAFLAARLETATGNDAADDRYLSIICGTDAAAPGAARDASESEKGVAEPSPSETLPSPTPIYVSYRDTQNTDPNATGPESARKPRGSLATPRGAGGAKSPTRNRAAASDSTAARDAAGTSPRVCETSRVRSLTAPQARRLYAAAHGKPPPKRLAHALKKLHAELEKLDAGLVEQLIEIVLRDERDAAFPAEADSSPREPRGEASSEGRNDGRRVSEPVPRLEPEPELAREEESPDKIPRVFAYAYAAPSASSRGESLGGARGFKVAALAEALARANDAIAAEASAGIEPATAADPAEGFPARATHLLVDTRDDADGTTPTKTKTKTKTRVRSRTVKYLEAVARGAWVLPFSYLDRCAAARRWLPERDFELEDAGRGVRAEDGSWTVPGPDDDEKPVSERFAVFGVGPAGGRARVAAGAPGAFAGEVVAVASAPARLLVSEMERLLLAGGAEAVLARAPGALARFTLPPPKTPKACETEVPESVPDSQASAEEETRSFGGAEGATAVVDGGDGAGVAVGEALGVPVMDWHWVFHSLVYHTPLPKKEYKVVEREKP